MIRAGFFVRGASVALLILGGCAAEGRMHLGKSSSVSGSATAESSETPEVAPSASPDAPKAVTDTTPAPSASQAAPPGCALVCTNAHPRARISPDAEARIGAAVAGELSQLRGCTGGRAPSLTLRFDSAGELTEFGIDDERSRRYVTGAAACVEALRSHRPAISYPGPATLRCSERCKR